MPVHRDVMAQKFTTPILKSPRRQFSFVTCCTMATLLVVMFVSSRGWSQGQATVATISAANFRPTVAPDSIVASFGQQFATGVQVAETVPLPTTLLGTVITVRDAAGASFAAPLLFVSPNQINYIVPAQAAPGIGTVVVRSGDGKVSEGPIDIAAVAPAIFTANQDGTGVPSAEVLHFAAGGGQSSETPYLLGEDQRYIPKAIDLGPSGDRVFLILYLTGLRGTPSTDANNDNGSAENVKVLTGGVAQTPLYAGRQGAFAGLDQINLEIPRTLLDSSLPGSKQIEISVKVAGYNDSNPVAIALAPPAGALALQITEVVAPSRLLANSTIQLNGVGISGLVDKNRISFGEGTGDPRAGEVRTASTTQISAVVPFGVQGGSIALNSDGKRWTSSSPMSVRTSFSAVIKDTEGQLLPPIAGAKVCFPDCTSQGALTTTLQSGGWFVLPDPPVGTRRIFVIEPPTQNTAFPFNRTLISSPINADRDNHLPQEIFLQAIYGPNGVVGNPTGLTAGLRLSVESTTAAPALTLSIAGFRLSVPAGADSTFPDGAKSGSITLTPVKNSLTPVPLPLGVFSSAIVQISPFGVKLSPGAKLVAPNLDNLPGSRQPILYKYDLNSASFVDTGIRGIFIDEGRSIETPAGAITDTSIYFFGLPSPTTTIAGRVLDSDGVTPVRGVVVRARGRQTVTDGNGGFSLQDVSVDATSTSSFRPSGRASRAAQNGIQVTASYLRPTGRTDTASGETGEPVAAGITNLNALKLSGSSSNRPPAILAPGVISIYATEINETVVVAVDPDTGQSIESLTASGVGFSSVQNLGNGSFSLKLSPKAADVGTHDLKLEARDSAGATASIDVSVIVLPVPVADAVALTTNEDTPASFILTGSDAGATSLTFAIVAMPLHGSLTGVAPNLAYTPHQNFNGSDSFTFTVSNGKVLSGPANVTLKINPVNDPPFISFGCVQTPPFLVGQTINCLVQTSDIEEAAGLSLSAEGLPAGVEFNTLTGTVEWVPSASQVGSLDIKFTVTDHGNPPLSSTQAVFLNVENPLPVLTLVAPNSGTAGDAATLITVTGAGFVPSSEIRFNGSPLATTFVDSTHLSGLIPAADLSLAGVASVSVFTPAPGGGMSNAQGFTVNNPAPAVVSLSPPSAQAGTAAFQLTVNGSGFVATTVVRWNGAARTTTYFSPTEVRASISAADIAIAGNANVDVVNPGPGGGTSNTLVFSITDPSPVISSTNPPSATAGGAAFQMIVTGSNFVADSIVRWEGANRTTTFNTSTQLTAQILASDIQNGGVFNLTVFNTGSGLTSVPLAFTVSNPSPVPATLLPDNAPTGSGDTVVTINGSGFVPSSVARWNGAPRTTSFVNANTLEVTVLASDMAIGSIGAISVFNPGPGGGTSGDLGFSVTNPPVPVITSTNPLMGLAGSGDTPIEISGGSFVPNSVVRVDGSPRVTTYINATTLSALFLASDFATTGTRALTVLNPPPGGGFSNPPFNFDIVNALPITTSINPTVVAQDTDMFELTVNGSGFAPTSVIQWNGSNRTTTFVNSGQLTASILSTDVTTMGTANITVFSPAPGGGTSAPAIPITIGNPVPVVTALNPSEVPVNLDIFSIQVQGSGFNMSSIVRFNGVDRTTTFLDAATLRAEILVSDLATAGTINVTVFNPAPAGGTSAPTVFTVSNPAPVVSLVNPTTIVVGSSATVVHVDGTGFVSTTVGLWNGSPRLTNIISSSELEVTIPATDLTTLGDKNFAVQSPAPGGGTSATTVISVVNPQPILTDTVPTSVAQSTPDFVLTVNGSGFIDGIQLLWNGSPRPATFISSMQFTAAIPLADLAVPSGVEISARNPAPAFADGNTIGFTITGGFAPVGSEEFTTHWNVRGSLNLGRTLLTATRLPDGSVLMTGGRALPAPNMMGDPLNSTELFDKASGTWQVAGEMNFARVGHSATFIPSAASPGATLDAFVLVVGGNSASSSVSARSAEVFSTRDRRWRVVNQPLFAHIGHTATLLRDGRVLVVGGQDDAGTISDKVEIYDPRSGEWAAAAAISTPRAYHSALLLHDGRVMIIGGQNLSYPLASAEIFDPETGKWHEASSLAYPRLGHSASLLPDGRVLVTGGRGDEAKDTAELFDPALGKWIVTGRLLTPRAGHSANVLDDGRVMITGGRDADGKVLVTSETFDPQTKQWSPAPRLNFPREGHAALTLDDGHILVIGGSTGASNIRLEPRTTSPRSTNQKLR